MFEHYDRFKEGSGLDNPAKSASPNASDDGNTPRTGAAGQKGNRSKAPRAKNNGGDRSSSYPHFFHGLGPNARRLFMELYDENRSRLGGPMPGGVATSSAAEHQTALSTAPSDGSSLPNLAEREGSRSSPRSVGDASARGRARGGGVGGGGVAADTVRHAAGAFAASGPPPDLDAGILDRYGALLGRLAEAATRIQRTRRLGALPRAARRLRHRQRAALAVQRTFRGHLARRYAII